MCKNNINYLYFSLMILYSLIYISNKSRECSESDINAILTSSYKNNKKNQVTGILLEYKNHFLQYLEGDPISIYELFEKIKSDTRHDSIFLAKFDKIEERKFKSWEMAYRNLENPDEIRLMSKTEMPIKLEEILNKQEFWKTIEVIEFMSNV